MSRVVRASTVFGQRVRARREELGWPQERVGVLIGIVLGGSQALSRSLFSQLVPRAREAEFFAFYQAMERGTSWFGTFVFGLVHQVTHSYRPAIVALILFFALGWFFLRKGDVRQGIKDAGNEMPAVVWP